MSDVVSAATSTRILVVTEPRAGAAITGVCYTLDGRDSDHFPPIRSDRNIHKMLPGSIFLPLNDVTFKEYRTWTRYQWKALFEEKVVWVWANSMLDTGHIHVRPLNTADDGSLWLPVSK